MEIKKSNKLLKALIATSFVGVVATPIVLTSCSKKNDEFSEQLLKVLSEEELTNAKGDKNVKFPKEFDENLTKTLACVVGDQEKDYKSFVIVLTLPFDKDAEDKQFTFEKPEVKSNNVKDDNNGFVKCEEEDVKDNKKVVKYKVTINADKSLIKEYDGKDGKTSDFSADATFSTIKFTFTDTKDKNKTATFTYKVTFEQKKADEASK